MNAPSLLGAALLILSVQPAHADLYRRADVTGRGGPNGKCTIEVNVDGAAAVEVSGDTGLLKTLSGRSAVWRRFECNRPLPRNPIDFRFVGVDGRGTMRLLREPRGNGGTAVVHINDPKGGREGYTFDLQWREIGGGGWVARAVTGPTGPRPRSGGVPSRKGNSILSGFRRGSAEPRWVPVRRV